MYHAALLRLEGAAIGAAALGLYVQRGESLLVLALLFLAPDLSMLGYLANRRTGSLAYNAVHTYVGPLALLGVGLLAGIDLAIVGGLIWAAHVGVDRAVGYGLKYADAPFSESHLQRLANPAEGTRPTPVDPVRAD